MRRVVLLIALGIVFLLGCEKVHTEADARELADKAFHEYVAEKKIEQGQFKEPRITYNGQAGAWEAYYARIGLPDSSKGVVILVDKFGRVELFGDQP